MISRDVIVIGVAEGSMPSLQRLLSGLPTSLPAAILIGLNRPLDALQLHLTLSQATALPLIYVREDQPLRRSHVHLAPPGMEMVIRASGELGANSAPSGQARHLTIDRLFKSTAQVLRQRVVAVLLSGSDAVGTQGLEAIERAGGIGIIQGLQDAAACTMPRPSIENSKQHYTAPAERMASLLEMLIQ